MKLINIRKIIKKKEDSLDEKPDEFYLKLKQELDDLLINVIGVPESGQHQIHQILDKAITGEIKEKTAVVAIHEIYKDYQKSDNDQDNNDEKNDNIESNQQEDSELEQLYKNGYR